MGRGWEEEGTAEEEYEDGHLGGRNSRISAGATFPVAVSLLSLGAPQAGQASASAATDAARARRCAEAAVAVRMRQR